MTKYRKLIAALVGAGTEAVALGLIDAKALAVAVAFLTALGVYAVPNEAPTPAADEEPSVAINATPHAAFYQPSAADVRVALRRRVDAAVGKEYVSLPVGVHHVSANVADVLIASGAAEIAEDE